MHRPRVSDGGDGTDTVGRAALSTIWRVIEYGVESVARGKGKRQWAVREGSEGSARTFTHSHALGILAHSLSQSFVA